MSKNVPGPGTKLVQFEDEFEGCTCSGVCLLESCRCLERFGGAYADDLTLVGMDPYLNSMKPLYECNKHCSCSGRCTNRVVQRGVQHELQVFKTAKKGMGLRTLQNIPKNTFVCEYAGEILQEAIAKNRSGSQSPVDSNYILVVKEHIGTAQIGKTCVDPTYIGNVGRFINHSCDPNLFMVPARVHHDVPCLALFALMDITCGDELTFDYSGDILSVSDEGISESNHDNIIEGMAMDRKPCFCGSEKCRGFLPLDENLYKP